MTVKSSSQEDSKEEAQQQKSMTAITVYIKSRYGKQIFH